MKTTTRVAMAFIGMLSIFSTTAQNNVGVGTTNPDPSAVLEANSTTQGFLPPRMSRGAILSISSAAEGLVAYNTDSKTLNVFNGTDWTDMAGNIVVPQVGDLYNEGVVFHIFTSLEPGYVLNETHGLICASSNEGGFVAWGCNVNVLGDNTGIGYGSQNTINIISNCGVNAYAANLCVARATNGGSPWFLPSVGELEEIVNQKTTIENATGLEIPLGWYHSSNDPSGGYVTLVHSDGIQANLTYSKSNAAAMVRPVRAF